MNRLNAYTLVMVGFLMVGITGLAPAIAEPLKGSDTAIENEIRHTLTLELRSEIFDWIEAAVEDGNIMLTGQVYDLSTKKNIIRYAKKIEGVRTIYDNVEILPASASDDRIRQKVARAIYRDPTFTPIGRAKIHIIVKGGRVSLEGVVNSRVEAKLAEARARHAGSVLQVENRLRVASELNS